jgi:hypothetical protein
MKAVPKQEGKQASRKRDTEAARGFEGWSKLEKNTRKNRENRKLSFLTPFLFFANA